VQVLKIKSQKDFYSGVMFSAVGVAFAWGATRYTIGEGARMGPGYFPLLLGIILALLGAAISFKALVVETEGGDKIGAWAWKPLGFIIAANLLFGPGSRWASSSRPTCCLACCWAACPASACRPWG